MWQRLLDRFAPLMEEPPSRLDRLDGIGGSPAPAGGTIAQPVASQHAGPVPGGA
jgi:hypothetical protein